METYKDLYVIALDKIQSLQLDLQDLQSLRHNMQAMSSNMVGENAYFKSKLFFQMPILIVFSRTTSFF